MATLWKKNINGKTYEVKSAGNRKRLFTDGVCHSEYNPSKIATGSIWDLLSIPVLFDTTRQFKRVLVLGVGGGAVIRQLHELVNPELITGIELNPTHLYVARRYFGLNNQSIELVEADAEEWLYLYSGLKYDMIVEDLFIEKDGEPVRAVEAGLKWVSKLEKVLAPNGILVMNHVSLRDMQNCAYFSNRSIQSKFKSAFSMTTPELDNYVSVFTRQYSDPAKLRSNLRSNTIFSRAIDSKYLNYKIRRISC